MSLYERIVEEARERGIAYQPPSMSPREPNPELRMLKSYVHSGPSNRWSAMAYASLRRKYPAAYERYLLEKGGGRWMYGFGGREDRG